MNKCGFCGEHEFKSGGGAKIILEGNVQQHTP